MTMFCEDHIPSDLEAVDHTENPFARCLECDASPGDEVESLVVIGGEP